MTPKPIELPEGWEMLGKGGSLYHDDYPCCTLEPCSDCVEVTAEGPHVAIPDAVLAAYLQAKGWGVVAP